MIKTITRLGVYGVVMEQGKMLLIRQKKGPYADKLDFPGGGVEFGESPEQTLRRELLQEIAIEFDSMNLIANLSATIQVNQSEPTPSYTFHHIGMVYGVEGCRLIKESQTGDLQPIWANLENLFEEECSALLWKYRMLTEK